MYIESDCIVTNYSKTVDFLIGFSSRSANQVSVPLSLCVRGVETCQDVGGPRPSAEPWGRGQSTQGCTQDYSSYLALLKSYMYNS